MVGRTDERRPKHRVSRNMREEGDENERGWEVRRWLRQQTAQLERSSPTFWNGVMRGGLIRRHLQDVKDLV
jgi:hypothetical protein